MRFTELVSVSTVLALLCIGCQETKPPAEVKQYQLTGQILDVRPEKQEVLVRHDEIKGFMAAMTMPYKVKDVGLLKDRVAGDLISATLVVSDSLGVLSTLTKTGEAPVNLPTPVAPDNPAKAPGEAMVAGSYMPDVTLTDQAGRTRALSSLGGHRFVLSFVYTTCPMPEYCPRIDREFVALQQAIARAPALADVRLVSITIDPATDTPEVLKKHAARLKANTAIWSFLTGSVDTIGPFAARFGLTVERNPRDPSDISHSLRTLVVGSDGRLATLRTGNSWTSTDILADLAAIPAPVN